MPEEKKKRKLFISCPMRGKTEDEIFSARAKLRKIAEAYEDEELEVIHNYNPEFTRINSVDALGQSIAAMAEADVYIGVDNCPADKFPGACIENAVVRLYPEVIKKHYLVDYKTVFGKDAY